MTLFTIKLHGAAQLFDLTGIFTAKVTGKQVHLQLHPSSNSQPLVFLIGYKKTGFVTGDHSLAHEYHHPMS
jgi:hypothetical protein